jgi:hypothetical protein
MDENNQEQVEARIFVGPWVSTREFADTLEQVRSEGGDVDLGELMLQLQREQDEREGEDT